MSIRKEYLSETREMAIVLQEMGEDIVNLKEKAIALPSGLPSDIHVQMSRPTDVMAARVADYADLEALYARTYETYLDRRRVILEASGGIPFRERLVIIRYYVRGESVADISEGMRISRSSFYKLLRSALIHIREQGGDDDTEEISCGCQVLSESMA